jgi:hypothetical protein
LNFAFLLFTFYFLLVFAKKNSPSRVPGEYKKETGGIRSLARIALSTVLLDFVPVMNDA